MKNVTTIFLGALLTLSFQATGQSLKLPENPELASEASRRFALSVDAISIDRYRDAANSLNWLMKNVPDLYDGLYINSYKAYEELAKTASDDTQKNMFLDSMMLSFNKKKEIYGLTTREKNNKAYRYYKYWKSDKTRIKNGMDAYKAAYEDPAKVINNNVVSYMDMARRYKAYGNDISNDEVIEIYTQVMNVIDMKAAAGEDAAKLERYKSVVNGLLTQVMGDDLNCDFINENLAPGLDQGDDLTLAKKVFGLLLERGCGDSPYIEVSAKIIQNAEPTEGIAKVLAQRAFGNKDYENAEKYYTEAMELSTDNQKKADLLMNIAQLKLAQGKKNEARKAALDAANIDPEKASEAYTYVANMYMNSFDDCSKKESMIADRSIFMAAYDLYQKAGNTEGMAEAKKQFPTVSDVFTANQEEGEAIRVGCWINVGTTIKVRKN
ncbi:tetratricopeptide repeat protein [Roseivirga sp.]|uniref:tetratricopeptide repeat protein n=1 Tax=Roseivirga sp. TaxID=1964215 RepID=UPI003B8D7B5B